MSDWNTTDTAPENALLMTKIDDKDGCRNEQALHRIGNLWFVPNGSMYVYYRPTHWRHLTQAERLKEERLIAATMDHARVSHTAALDRIWKVQP